MLDSTGASGFLPTVTFDGSSGVFTSAHRINKLNNIGITGLYEADFSNAVTVIDVSAFAFDTKVVVATINNVTSIRSDAFYGCTAIRSITLDCAANASTKRYLLTDISSAAFRGCTSLRNLHIPDTVKIIPDNMCNGCTSLEVAVMGYGCDRTGDTYNTTGRIGSSAFANCSRLSYFVVPETVGGISDSAFANDVSLGLVYILGRPDISANAFTSARGTGATYYFDNSASYTTLTAVTSASLFPTASTKRPYREFNLTATGELTPATVRSTIPATTYWKGKILNSVTSLATSCFAGAGSGADIKYPYMVGLSLPPGLLTIGYGAFINTDGTSGYSSIIGAFYIPNSVGTLAVINATSNTFAGLNTTLRDSSTTKQIVFQSGTNTIAFPAVTFKFSSAMAIIAPTATSFGSECFNFAKNVQLYSFFQKNAYTATTRLDGVTNDTGNDLFSSNFNTGIAGHTHYLYIPKQITRIAANAFRAVTNNINVTAYHNFNLNTDVAGMGFGFFTYDATVGNTARFTGAAPTINIIYNYYDAAGLVLTTSSSIGNNFPLHVLYPSGVKTITNRFASTTTLRTVTISDTVTDINTSAFSGCTGLTRLNISHRSNLTNVGASAFLNCTALTTFFIPNSLDGINNGTFSGCTNLASVTYGNNPGIKFIDYQAFYNTTNKLTSIFIPSSVVYIGYQVFINGSLLNNLNTVTFGAGSRLRSIGGSCFGIVNGTTVAATYLRDLVLPNTIRAIGTNSTANSTTCQVFRNTFTRTYSANLVFPSSLELISESILFSDNTTTNRLDISNIYLPLSITNVAGPRKHCGYTTNGFVNNEFAPSSSKAGSLIYLPSHLSGYTGVSTTFPDANRARSFYRTVSFTTNPLTTLGLSASVPTNTTNAVTTTQIHADIQEGVIVIGGGTKNITSATGDGSRNLISVNIPSTVTTISANAFDGCNALVYITFSENSRLTTIGNSAFLGCTMIHDIKLPDTLTTIGPNAFSGCSNLASISIPYNTTSLGAGAFTSINTVFKQLGQDIDATVAGDNVGRSVSLSADGLTIAVGYPLNDANGSNSGQCRMFKYISHTWIQIGQTIIGEGAGDACGYAVSLNADGTIVAIGSNANTNANGSTSGQVRVYKYNSDIWIQLGQDIDGETGTTLAVGDRFGWSVALSADGTIVAGGATNNDGTTGSVTDNRGHCRIFKYNSATNTWTKLGQDIDGAVTGDQFGYSIALSADGTIVASGAYFNDANGLNSGHCRIFKYNSGTNTWIKLGQDLIGKVAGDRLGSSVALSADGTIVAMGAMLNDANGNESGHTLVYKYNSGSNTWTQLGQDIIGKAANDQSGISVSLSTDGTIVAIGARWNDDGGANTGHCRLFKYNSGTNAWTQFGQDIIGEAAGDEFGTSVSLSADGSFVAVGGVLNDAGGLDSGHCRVYTISTLKSVQMHQRLHNDISGSLQTYFTNPSTIMFQVIPALQLTNTLNPTKLTISQINNMYIRYRQSQLGDCTFITVVASYGDGILRAIDITTALASSAGLVHLDISTNVTSIDGEVCLNNSRIYSVAISKTVTSIGTSVFNGCTNLSYLSFHPDSVCTTIGVAAVYNTNIFDLALPDSLTTIGIDAFRSSTNLTSVCIPKNVTSLGGNAFFNCPKLTAVALPSSLPLATFGTATYFNINGSSTTGITFSSYSNSGAIAHFKLSDYSLPNGIVQNVVDSAVTYIDHRAYAYYPDITLYAVTTNKQTVTGGPYTYPANNVQIPIMPATFLLNGGSVISNSMFPIYRSVPDLNVFSGSSTTTDWPENQDDFYILMPGYSICIYNNLYDEENIFTDSPTYRYYDNEFETVPLNINITGVSNTTSSILILNEGRILTKYFLN